MGGIAVLETELGDASARLKEATLDKKAEPNVVAEVVNIKLAVLQKEKS